MNYLDLIISLVGGAGSTITPIILIWLAKGQKTSEEKQGEISKKIDNLAHNDFRILKARLRTETIKIINRGYITYNELDNLEDLFEIYADMGGNGIVEQNMKKIRKLPLKGE